MIKVFRDNKVINKAFLIICLDRYNESGYVDVSIFVQHTKNKHVVETTLLEASSPFADLYEKTYPTVGTLERLITDFIDGTYDPNDMTAMDAEGILYWAFAALKRTDDRLSFTLDLFRSYDINAQIVGRGIVYNDSKIDLHILSTLSDVNDLVSELEGEVFFRGHSNANYQLQPSIMRSNEWLSHESEMYNAIQIACPEEFENCNSCFERLVKMQHYGLPTRLLDVTSNPLVALYFACESNADQYGELVLIRSPKGTTPQYYNAETVSILSNLASISFQDYCALLTHFSGVDYKKAASRLLDSVHREKPYIDMVDDLRGSCIVYALKKNDRIIKQDGAFILSGLIRSCEELDVFRYTSDKKIVVALIDNKKKMLKSLDSFSINEASLFPEIDKVAEYLKRKYS